MRMWIIVVLIVLLLVFSSFATHKEPSLPITASSEEEYGYRLTLGSLHLKQSDSGTAIDYLKKALVIKPDSARAHNLLGIAYFQQKDYKLAEAQYKMTGFKGWQRIDTEKSLKGSGKIREFRISERYNQLRDA